MSSLQAQPRGLLRVTVGPNASWLGDIVADYMKRNPGGYLFKLVP